MNRLLIQLRDGNFWHRKNENPLSDRNVSDFEVSIDENFVIVELDGSQNWNYKIENVSVQVGISGTIESFNNRLFLISRLKELGYTPYLVVNGLTLNELSSIRSSNNPSTNNPFATMLDVIAGGTTRAPRFILTLTSLNFTLVAPYIGKIHNITNKNNLSQVVDWVQTNNDIVIQNNCEIGDLIEITF